MYFVFAMCIYTFLFFLLGVGRWLKSEPVWNRFTRRRRQLHSSCVTCPDVWKQRLGSPSPLGGFGLYCEPRVGQGQIATHPLVGARNTSFVTRWQNPLAVFVNLLIPSTEKYTKQEKHTLYIFLSYQKRNVYKKNKKKRRGMAFFFLPFSLYFDKVKIPQWGVSPLPSQKKKNHRRIKYFFLLFFLVFFPGSLTGAAIFDDELNQTAKMRKLRATLSTIGTHTNTYMKLVYQRAR
jgi:hypothetical protein